MAPYITQTCLCNILRYFTAVKNDNFQMKICDIFLIFAQNIDRGRISEAVLTSTHNLCFRAKIRKNKYPFYYVKVGCKGVFITRTCPDVTPSKHQYRNTAININTMMKQ